LSAPKTRVERAQNRAQILARGVEQEGLLARDPRGHVDGSAGKRRRRLAGGAGTEQSGAGLARERARLGSGAREAVRKRRRWGPAAAAVRSGEHWRGGGGVRVVERERPSATVRVEKRKKRG